MSRPAGRVSRRAAARRRPQPDPPSHEPPSSDAIPRVLHLFRDGPLDGPTNMARDEHLLYDEASRPAALRLYRWHPPTISLGYFQRHAQLAALPEPLRSLAVVRRTTGGGAILHDREITYCLVVDDSLPAGRGGPPALYRLVHGAWRDALAEAHIATELAPPELPLPSPRSGPFFCFEKPGQTDLLLGGRKLAGSAQRRIPGRVLQHGSLLLGRRFEGHPGAALPQLPPERIETLCDAFAARLTALLGLEARSESWRPDALADVAARRERYAGREWLELR